MRGLLRRHCYFYSNISLKFENNHAAYLTLSNQKKRNPLSLETIKQIGSALQDVQSKISQNNLKILVIKGDGPVFSAGHDLKELKASKDPSNIFSQFTKNLLLLRKLPIVTLCAINGVAAAAGFQMALTCDMIIASQKSTFSTPGVKWGLFCSTPGVQLIRSISSQKKARQMLLFGESITAGQALQYGLINKVVKAEQIEEEVNNYISKAGKLSGEVISLGKKVFNEQSNLNLEDAYCIAEKGMSQNITTKSDCQEGLSAFAEKRHPHFKH